MPSRFQSKHQAHVKGFAKKPKVRAMGAGDAEYFAQHKDRKEFPVEIGLSPLELAEGFLTSVAIRDITERKEAHDELKKAKSRIQDFAALLNHSVEEERTSIAREIHDELGQQITALKMDIAWILHKQTNTEEAVLAKLQNSLKMIDGFIATIRKISSDLRPAIIDDLGLLATLEWKCHDFEEKMGIPCKFISQVKEREFDAHFSINTYRILQETLTNISRHAQAKSVIVSVSEDEKVLFLEISDNGKGISDERVQNSKTLGITGMKERAALLGGKLTIEGTTGKGTRTQLILPFKNKYVNS
jgi:signal transduction histidine kinase